MAITPMLPEVWLHSDCKQYWKPLYGSQESKTIIEFGFIYLQYLILAKYGPPLYITSMKGFQYNLGFTY